MLIKLLRSALIGLLVACVVLVLTALFNTNGSLFGRDDGDQSATPVSYNQAVRRAAPAVVNVYNNSFNASSTDKLSVQTLGSGVIMNDKGYILTNKHVINNAEQIVVALQDGRVYESVQLIGSDDMTDLAVLKVDADNLPAIPVNPKRSFHIGDVVLAIGNPYNLGQTITQGIISATGRVSMSSFGRQNFLQTDASINHGNSGGALINTLGELVGINTLSFDKSDDGETPEGIGFAIPVALATKIMGKLIRDGRVIRGYIGIQGGQAFNHQNQQPQQMPGILVKEVYPDGPADKAGIQEADWVLSVNNKPVRSVLETMDEVAELAPGTVIPIVIDRNKKILTVQVTIQEFPN
ncbi:outer membrane-stress sensor serine endopeptidase DegS [Affinibrenneria salicis]|uniref:Serine endoprotease DegS n=1 Tax=Affinibrenneria salicis TaxID=2590031 RepID=A0A5J5FZA1_9GAMM|nr:outer membrane-stress sensor serine endopeptidase DegS [Affinibrenneria salicis]KAA8999244.1 outer membrane-stress sensor serine endopeptidase DegS [Affinibrenneria salicis]